MVRAPETVAHRGIRETSRRLNANRKAIGCNHRVYDTAVIKSLPEGFWVVGPTDLNRRIEESKQKITSVVWAPSLRISRVVAVDKNGKRLDLTQALSDELAGEYGAVEGQHGEGPFKPSLEHARKGLSFPQAINLVHALRVARSLGKPLHVYMPDVEYGIFVRKNSEILGIDGLKLLNEHIKALTTQTKKLAKALFPDVKVTVVKISEKVPGEGNPLEGHFTRAFLPEQVGAGRGLLRLARRDDGTSTKSFKRLRKKHGLFLLEQHASGMVTNAKPYDADRDGLHLISSSAPPVYLRGTIRELQKRVGTKLDVADLLSQDILAGADFGSGPELTLGEKIEGKVFDPKGEVTKAYKHALKGIIGGNTVKVLLRKLNATVSR